MLLIELNSVSNMGCHLSRRASVRNDTVLELFITFKLIFRLT
jgi:hypothetical protein